MAGDGHNRHKRPNRRVCDGGRWAMGIRGLIGGCVMAGGGHNRLNMPNRRVVRWRVVRWRVV